MFTTPNAEVNFTGTRAGNLDRWLKQTQEALAHRSLHGHTFSRLFNLLRTKRLVELAAHNVLRNAGAKTAGVDGVTSRDLLAKNGERLYAMTDALWRDLSTKSYHPAPVRRVYIPKASGGQRPLGIPTLRDRVVQEMLRLILEPIYESRFYAHSYGFRPFRSTHHAAVRIKDLIGRRGYTVAIEGDIRKCFDRIHHLTLVRILRRTITDERIIKLVQQLLKAGVMEDGAWHVTDEGSPQGGIVSPLLANIYLNELDQFIAAKWADLGKGEQNRHRSKQTALPCYLVRYADDFVILIRGTVEQAEQLKAEVADFLRQALQLELSAEKTLVTPVTTGFDFLGFHTRKYPEGKAIITPSRTAIARFREQVKTRAASAFRDNDAAGIATLNRYIRGWGEYYRHVSSSQVFKTLDHYVWDRVMHIAYRLRGKSQGVSFAKFWQARTIPYRFDVYRKNREREGGHYGTWANQAHDCAYIVTKLAFQSIEYVALHSQLHPYLPVDRLLLERQVTRQQLGLTPEPTGSRVNPDYGPAWKVARETKLVAANHRCETCGTPISGRTAIVHHRQPLKEARNRQQAHMLENLICLCPSCHGRAEHALRKADQ
jgi:group II intron reverse transcriptase/maturase